jgi:phage FluMu gp28-like protein
MSATKAVTRWSWRLLLGMKLNMSRPVTVVWRVRVRVSLVVPVVVVDAVEFARDRLDFWPDLRQAEISTVAAAKAVHQAYFYSGSLTLMVAPSARQSGEFLRKAAGLLGRVGIRVRGDGTNESSILLPNGSRLVALPGNEATIRGFSKVSLLLIDEASRVSDEMYQALRPMLAVGDGDLLMMSTPNGRRGFFWEAWSEGGDGWERWSVPATECARIPESFLAEERRTMGERGFRQEYLCEFLEMEGALFTEEMIQRAFRDDVKPLEIRRR